MISWIGRSILNTQSGADSEVHRTPSLVSRIASSAERSPCECARVLVRRSVSFRWALVADVGKSLRPVESLMIVK